VASKEGFKYCMALFLTWVSDLPRVINTGRGTYQNSF
jgi:hypothetical protein